MRREVTSMYQSAKSPQKKSYSVRPASPKSSFSCSRVLSSTTYAAGARNNEQGSWPACALPFYKPPQGGLTACSIVPDCPFGSVTHRTWHSDNGARAHHVQGADNPALRQRQRLQAGS